MNANKQGPEIHDQVSNSAPEDMELRSDTDNLSSDTEWSSTAPEDVGLESEADKVPLSFIEWDAGSPQTHEPELKHNVFSSPGIESDTGVAPGAAESKVMPSERSQSSSQDNPESVPSVEAPEQDTAEKEKLKLPIKLPNTVVMKELPSKGKEFETKNANYLSMNISKKVAKTPASSGSHWSGIPMPHGKNGNLNLNIRLESLGNQGVHTKKGKSKRSEKESGGEIVRVLNISFVFGGLLVVLMMAAFFAFAWPLRKYYQKLSQRLNEREVESGLGDGNVRVDRNQPPVSRSQRYHSPCQQEPTSESYQNPGNSGNVSVSDRRAYFRGGVQAYQTTSAPKKSKKKTKDEVISDDKKRDPRNVERRKIIKQQTSQRRASLADSIAIAKSVIDGHSKNRQFEKKASERRRVIKQSTSAPGSSTGEKPRCMSFFQELETACSVILPGADHQKSVERSKDRRRTIKDRSDGKRRRSLAEEIEDAKKVIVDSKRKYETSPAVVDEAMLVGQRPRSWATYSYTDILDLLPQFKDLTAE